MSVRLCMGDCVLVKADEFKDNEAGQLIGLIKYIGYIHGANMQMRQYIGVELMEPIQNGHDGTINGYQYFTAPKGHGIHLQIADVIKKLNMEELWMKLKDIITFFKTKLSQYMNALNERDEYIEKLKYKQKDLKARLNQSTATLQHTVSHISDMNSKHKNKKKKKKNENTDSQKQQLPIINNTTSLSTESTLYHNNNAVNAAQNMYDFMTLNENDTMNSSVRIAPITPITPIFTPYNNNSNGTVSTTKTNTPVMTPNMANTKTENNSNSTSYASTNNTTSGTHTTSTYTTSKNTMGSTRAVLEVIHDTTETEETDKTSKNNNHTNQRTQPQPQPHHIATKMISDPNRMHNSKQQQQQQQQQRPSPKLMINTNYNVYNMPNQGQTQPYHQISPPQQIYYTQFSPKLNHHKYKAIQSPIQYQIIPPSHIHLQQIQHQHAQNKAVIMPAYNKQYVRYQPQPQPSPQLQQMMLENDMYQQKNAINKHIKQNKKKQQYQIQQVNGSIVNVIPRKESDSTEWTESTYNSTDIDTLQNSGFVISNQYMYGDAQL